MSYQLPDYLVPSPSFFLTRLIKIKILLTLNLYWLSTSSKSPYTLTSSGKQAAFD